MIVLDGCTAQSSIAAVLLYSIYVHSTVANRQSWLLGHPNSVHLLGAPRSGVERASHFLCGLWLCRCRRRRWHRPHARREARRATARWGWDLGPGPLCAAGSHALPPGPDHARAVLHVVMWIHMVPARRYLPACPSRPGCRAHRRNLPPPLAVAACVRSIGLAFTVRSTSQQQSGQMAAKLLWQ